MILSITCVLVDVIVMLGYATLAAPLDASGTKRKRHAYPKSYLWFPVYCRWRPAVRRFTLFYACAARPGFWLPMLITIISSSFSFICITFSHNQRRFLPRFRSCVMLFRGLLLSFLVSEFIGRARCITAHSVRA